MEQLEFFNIPSPCIGVCEVNNRGYCKGCLRNRTERQLWQQMSDGQKREVMRILVERRRKIRARQNNWDYVAAENIEQQELWGDLF